MQTGSDGISMATRLAEYVVLWVTYRILTELPAMGKVYVFEMRTYAEMNKTIS